jgi:hypothetical protein
MKLSNSIFKLAFLSSAALGILLGVLALFGDGSFALIGSLLFGAIYLLAGLLFSNMANNSELWFWVLTGLVGFVGTYIYHFVWGFLIKYFLKNRTNWKICSIVAVVLLVSSFFVINGVAIYFMLSRVLI